jgi:hypothetical protein
MEAEFEISLSVTLDAAARRILEIIFLGTFLES